MRAKRDFSHKFKRRLSFLLIIFTLSFLIIFVNLARLQLYEYDKYTTQSKNNQISIKALAPIRGKIFDRNGVLLADNRIIHNLYIIPKLVKDIEKTISVIDQFVDIDKQKKEQLINNFAKRRYYKTVLVKTDLNEEEINKISTLKPIYPEFKIEIDAVRYYPYGLQSAHIIGYVGKISQKEKQRLDLSSYRGIDNIGKTGIEKIYESLLKGQTGFIHSESNAYGVNVRVLQLDKPIKGKDLFLSLDIRLQGFAQNLLKGQRGSIVILENKTGSVLVLASSPSFDANWFIDGISHTNYKSLLNNPDKPLLNRAIKGQYPPGSIIKPYVALAGIEFKQIQMDEEIYCPGWYKLPNVEKRTFYGWKKIGHGSVDMQKSIVESCDIYFYELSRRLGVDNMYQYLSQFSLGQLTGIDLDGEQNGLMPSTQWKKNRFGQSWYLGETLIAGIGQGYMLMTPLQAAFSMMILANHGINAKPKLLYALRDDKDSEIIYQQNPKQTYLEIKDKQALELVINALKDVIHSRKGTAKHIAFGSAQLIAGKTGTAQVAKIDRDEDGNALNSTLNDHAWFTAFSPVNDPEITIAVIVENGGGGSSVAAPIAKQMINRYFELYPKNQ